MLNLNKQHSTRSVSPTRALNDEGRSLEMTKMGFKRSEERPEDLFCYDLSNFQDPYGAKGKFIQPKTKKLPFIIYSNFRKNRSSIKIQHSS